METTISLKQLRTDPRSYIRLLRQGYEVTITEHRKAMVTSVGLKKGTDKRGSISGLLKTLENLGPAVKPDSALDTVEMVKKTKLRALEEKFGENDRS